MKDFTFQVFIDLLKTFLASEYRIITVEDYFISNPQDKVIILRHDVDRYPSNTLRMAILEKDAGIKATYYFRIIPSVFKHDIIKKVRKLGHEVSYHYEDLSIVKGDYNKAMIHFEESLLKVREFAPARTICMHGSPLSKWDNKKLWDKFNYGNYGVIGDTSLDIDYNRIFYISDNGWGWNNTEVSVRDKVTTNYQIPINGTKHLMELVKKNRLPNQIMINAHPDTFFDPGLGWYFNMVLIKSKNIVKRQIVKYNLFD